MSLRLRASLLVIVVISIAAVITVLEAASSPEDGTPAGRDSTSSEDTASRLSADLRGIEGWLNGDSLTSLTELQGKVVLLDFWTYSCINCIRTLPFLRAWHERYADDGLVIIGIHTPEFAFEKSIENVQQATEDLDVPWLVALDNERRTWDAFRVRAWPTKILLGPNGEERRRIIGEGRYEETEELIRLMLVEAGKDPTADSSGLADPDFNAYRGLTREVYGGWRFQYLSSISFLGNGDEANFDEPSAYSDPGPPRPNGVFFLQGMWEHQEEAVRHARVTDRYEDYVAIAYSARVVNVVVRPQGAVKGPSRVLVTLDGEPLTEETRGRDVVLEEGASYLVVQAPRLYAVVATPELGRHELRLSPLSDDFALHTYTFGP